MWKNPKSADEVEQARPPEQTGKLLGSWPRGRDAELRLSLDEYKGRPFLGIRVWERGRDGQLWPSKGKGCSIRVGELSGVIKALQAAAEQLGDDGPARGYDGGTGTPYQRQASQGGHQRPGDAPPARRATEAPQSRGGSPGPAPGPADPDRPTYVERRRRPEPREIKSGDVPPPRVGDGNFDEFGEES